MYICIYIFTWSKPMAHSLVIILAYYSYCHFMVVPYEPCDLLYTFDHPERLHIT
jgi:hypothetical protein